MTAKQQRNHQQRENQQIFQCYIHMGATWNRWGKGVNKQLFGMKGDQQIPCLGEDVVAAVSEYHFGLIRIAKERIWMLIYLIIIRDQRRSWILLQRSNENDSWYDCRQTRQQWQRQVLRVHLDGASRENRRKLCIIRAYRVTKEKGLDQHRPTGVEG